MSKDGEGADRVQRELDDLFDEFDTLLKSPEAGDFFASRGVNVSLAMTAADGLRAYLKGEKERASDDFLTVGEEIRHRLSLRCSFSGKEPS